MTLKSLLTVGLLTFVVVSLSVAVTDVAGFRSSPILTAPPANAPEGEQWVAYYFHSSHRCPTCRAIEANTRNALADQVAQNAVLLRVHNYEDSAHQHFVKAFDLAFPMVILAQVKDGATLRWKPLERVWELWEDGPAFERYVQSELAQFKEDRP